MRHNEVLYIKYFHVFSIDGPFHKDIMNEELARSCSLPVAGALDSPHTKCFLLLQV